MNNTAINILSMQVPQGQMGVIFMGQAGLIIKTPKGELAGVDLYLSDCCERYHGFKRLMPKLISDSDIEFDYIITTHSHYDHFDRAAVEDVTTKKSAIICDKTTAESLDGDAIVMTPGMQAQLDGGIIIEAVAAYNTSEGHTDFHPKAREDNGYIIRFEGLNIYVAGDTEPTEEMKSLKDIDIAFLPVNQPYTMTVDQAVEAIKAIKPRIFYPYHYGEVDEKTDIERLKRELEGITDVRVFPME
jgi:L-ascorbate metabolism protein UlaG (beta-lactamase superfamily)